MKKPITAVIVGAGHRSLGYTSYSQSHPDQLKIVGIADPNTYRRQQTAQTYHLPSEACFNSAFDLAGKPPLADAVINGTMDKDHVPTSLPLLKAGYHILLEKPIGVSREEVLSLLDAARTYKRKVMICHVLRYAPFYAEIRKRLAAGEIGRVLNIQTAELVSYHHMGTCFVRGKWSRKDQCLSSMLMSKCCHVDCSVETDCLYSAKKMYVDHPDRWGFYVWNCIEHLENSTLEQKIESLKTNNPHGRCVWKCDNDVVDHQSVVIQFADGATATHNLVGGVSKPCRKIHIIGTTGEIDGVMEDGFFFLKRPDPRPGHESAEEKIDCNVSADMHGGGDLRLVEDFIKTIQGEAPSLSSTNLEDSIYGHLIGFTADRAMAEHRVLDLEIL